MSRIARATQKLFGSTGSTSDFGEFGSKAAGAPATTKSPATIQALGAFLTGWTAATVAQDRPYLEDMNSLFLLAFQQIAYGLQLGIPEWDAGTTYYIGSIAQDGTGVVYKSLTDANLNNALSDATKWASVVPSPTTGGAASSFKNLKVTRGSVTQITVTADELVLENSSHEKVSVFALNKTADITVTGAGGLMTGLTEGNKWYYVWIIRKSSDGTTSIILTESATTIATLPSGYDQYALVSAVHNTSGDFVDFKQYGCDYWYSAWPVAASGAVGIASWVSVDLTDYVPSGLSEILRFSIPCYGSNTYVVGITNDNSVDNLNQGMPGGTGNPTRNRQAALSSDEGDVSGEMNIITANTVWWGAVGSYSRFFVCGFKITKLS